MLCIFFILGVAVFTVFNSSTKKSESVQPELDLLFPSLNPDTISSIVIGSFGGNIDLVKKDGVWMVQDGDAAFPADKEAIDKLFGTTAKLKGLQVISRNPQKHVEFQVNASQESMVTDESGESKPFKMGTMGTEITMIQEDGSAGPHFFVGKNAAMDFMTTYIRKADSDNVLLADGYLKMIFGKGNAAAWKDLMLCKIDPGTIEKITIGSGDAAMELMQIPGDAADVQAEKPATIWKMTRPDRGVIAESAIQKLTGIFRNFRASDFAPALENPSDYGFEDPEAIVSVTLKDTQETITFIFGKVEDDQKNQHYLKKEGHDAVYLIPKYRLDSIPKNPDDFFNAS